MWVVDVAVPVDAYQLVLSAFEQNALEGMLDTLKKDIALGEEFVNK